MGGELSRVPRSGRKSLIVGVNGYWVGAQRECRGKVNLVAWKGFAGGSCRKSLITGHWAGTHGGCRDKVSLVSRRGFAGESCRKGLVVGFYEGSGPGEVVLTPAAEKMNDQSGGKLLSVIREARLPRGSARAFMNLVTDFQALAVACLGQECTSFNSLEGLDQGKESSRAAAGVGTALLQDLGVGQIFVEDMGDAEAAGEGATLAAWQYTELRSPDDRLHQPKLELFGPDKDGWGRGVLKAEAQNTARKLEEMPANIMTPSKFTQAAFDILSPCGVHVDVKDQEWLESKRMNAILSVSKGSCDPPMLIKLQYFAGDQEGCPTALVGKGVTFDSGGLCVKPPLDMAEHRADMAGAAVVVGVFKAVAQMELPINLLGVIPLVENMLGGMSMKPGDTILSQSGKTILVEDTDNEGRVIMADALAYASDYLPPTIISIGTESLGMRRALGFSSTGVFSTSDDIWRQLAKAGSITGDRVWRLPLWKYFSQRVTACGGVDVGSMSSQTLGDPCLGAAFLLQFAPPTAHLVHLDISGTGMLAPTGRFPYLRKGLMTGRPTRTLAQYFLQQACPLLPEK